MLARAFLVTFALATLAGGARADGEPPSFCDIDKVNEAQNTEIADGTRYKPRLGQQGRVDRCEGRYFQQQAAPPPAQLVAVWRACAAPAPTAAANLRLDWVTSPAKSLVRVQIQSVAAPYLLDATAPSSQASFGWDDRILRELSIPRASLASAVWTEAHGRRIYLPAFWHDADPTCEPSYRLLFTGVSKASKVTISVRPVEANLNARTTTQDGAFAKGPASVVIPLRRFDSGDGLYDVTVQFEGGAASTLVLYHHGSAK